ncbi:hypothetical protein [Streptomyces sp. NPDC001194]|uniref:hypothetical protein n=1 Tax=Streptomyces sp. NPDC001194 TaxID=3364547 RepID=UPI0036778ABB
MHKWSATATAVAALAISSFNFAELQRQPDVDLEIPHLLRLEKLGNDVRFYVQPTISTRVKSEEVEVIRDARLQLTPTVSVSYSKRPVFYWRESVVWYYEPSSDTVNSRWSGDPAPFIVSQDKPQQPSFEFRANNWMYQAGQYEGSLELIRSGAHKALTKKFCLIISESAVNELTNPEPPDQTIRFFRNDLPKFASSSCFRRDTD